MACRDARSRSASLDGKASETSPTRVQLWHGLGRLSDRQRTGDYSNLVNGTIYDANNVDSGTGCCLATPDDE